DRTASQPPLAAGLQPGAWQGWWTCRPPHHGRALSPTFGPMFLIWLYYHGEVGIDPWEWLLSVVYIAVLFLYFSRQKRLRLSREPEYKHFVYGLNAKLAGAMAFSLIYFYYYGG